MRILIVEDEASLREMLATSLGRQGMLVDLAPTLAMAREAVLGIDYDAIVLDRSLPDGDGLSLFNELGNRPLRPSVIVLSALGTLDQRIEGLDLGADDYLAKPFATEELLARLRAVTRRPSTMAQDRIRLGRMSFDRADRSTEIDGVVMNLPRRELLVLEALLLRSGRVVSREGLEQAVYGYDDDIASNTLDAHISRLRRKLEPAGVEIHALRGIGYLIRAVE
ncbi:response regulator transcription factor [Paracoccus aestuariivivens]|uniref:Response regulator n=1 Tax=Paracoccus aestuariivivens TaxID=1820333 RepID=A0A6L6J4M8_9RHOB|nr:response regulator transcription factor [Paracoccus aestuariivivens]MTH77043.1 response regulator [Paracoccus aestuariivivens]